MKKVDLLICFYLTVFISFGCVLSRNNKTEFDNSNEIILYDPANWSPLISDRLNRIVLKGKINGTDCNIMIDTGGSVEAISMDSTFFFSQIDTVDLNSESIRMPDKLLIAGLYHGNIPITISGVTCYAKTIYIRTSRFSYFRENDNHNAVIGLFFHDKIMMVDFDENKIAFSDSLIFDTVDYKSIKMYSPQKLTEDIGGRNNHHERYVEIDGFIDKNGNEIKGRFLFDTGCNIPLILKSDFGEKLKVPENYKSFRNPKETREGLRVWYANNLKIGGIDFDSIKTDQSLHGGHPGYPWGLNDLGGEGLMGMGFINRFNFIADFKNNILYLKPNKNYYEFNVSE